MSLADPDAIARLAASLSAANARDLSLCLEVFARTFASSRLRTGQRLWRKGLVTPVPSRGRGAAPHQSVRWVPSPLGRQVYRVLFLQRGGGEEP